MSNTKTLGRIGLGLLLVAGCMEFQRSLIPQGDTGRQDFGPVVADDDDGMPELAADLEEVQTESGLRIVDVEIGLGAPVADGDEVDAHYTGWLEDGTQFDSSHDRGEPLTVVVGTGSVIAGWDEGLVGMRTGGWRRLTIPPELGYGETGSGEAVPPDATLIFDIELTALRPENWGADAATDGIGTDGADTDGADDRPDDAPPDGAETDDAAPDGADASTDGVDDAGTNGVGTDGMDDVGTDGAGTDGADDAGTDGTDDPADDEGIPEISEDLEEVTSETGLKYIDLVVGEGAAAGGGDTLDVHYTGWLEDGTKFDSSYDRGTPFTVTLGTGGVIAGWDEGLRGIRQGGQRRLIIPPDLAYGEAGNASIPPNSTLIFDVEVVALNP